MSSKQAGMVSIFVTMIMMVVVSLIVLGFAQVSRREQRESLDRQLSSEAFYAAESGINDARQVVAAAGNNLQDKTTCGPDSNYRANPMLDAANNISYSCLLVNTQLTTIKNSLVANGNSVNEPIEPASGMVQSLHINWNADPAPTQQSDVNKCAATVPTSGDFSKSSSWACPYGVLRVDLVPTGTLSRAALSAGQKTMFFYPTRNGSGSVAAADGVVAAMKCTLAAGCNVDISGVTGSTTYALRLSALYVGGKFIVSAQDGGVNLQLKNAQVEVDATGKAQDVLRRIQVTLPLAPSNSTPDFAIESASSICKRFSITPNSFIIPGDIVGQDQNNPTCKAMSVSPQPNPTTACTLRGPNNTINGDFHLGAGPNPQVDPNIYGFTTLLPNRGQDTYPDDNGTDGSNANFQGWAGGLSVYDDAPQTINTGYVQLNPFPGDTTVSPAVAPNIYALVTNPNQSINDPKGTKRTNTFQGALWQANLNNLTPGATYDFSGYFSNVLTPKYFAHQHDAVNAKIGFSINKTILRAQEVIQPHDPNDWERISLQFTATQASNVFDIEDFAGNVSGDDFAMTSLGVYKCLN